MGNTDNLDSWEQIRRGVVRVEALISQKQFNASMVEALQVLNLMLKGLAEKACIVETDPMLIIDELYQDRWISKSTCEHYHKIRIIGTKALNEGSNNAYDASQAHQLLSQEVYTFANEFYKVKKTASFPQIWFQDSRKEHSGGEKRHRRPGFCCPAGRPGAEKTGKPAGCP